MEFLSPGVSLSSHPSALCFCSLTKVAFDKFSLNVDYGLIYRKSDLGIWLDKFSITTTYLQSTGAQWLSGRVLTGSRSGPILSSRLIKK